jgi:threonine synthase
MGVPIPGFKVATNQNDILHRLFTTGEYRTGPVQPSLAPSMDIQMASNFERFLYYELDCDAAKVRTVMAQFNSNGGYRFANFDRSTFSSSSATDAEITGLIRRVHERHGYVVDPHTACAFKDLNPDRISVVLATAHPAKFPEAIRAAISQEPVHPTLEALKSRPVVKHRLPADEAAIKAFIAARAV